MKSKTAKQHHKADIIIIGAGLAGLSLACILAPAGLRIVIADAADPAKPMTGDERTTAISYGASKVLAQGGVWDDLVSAGCPIDDIEILDGDSPSLLQFLKSEVEGKSFGWIIENTRIREILKKRLAAFDNVAIKAPCAFKGYAQAADESLQVHFADGSVMTARLLVGADGRGSAVREALDIECRRKDYRQTAFVALVRHENAHNNTAVEHFWPEGPLAILPMRDDEKGQHRSAVVLTVHGKGALAGRLRDAEFFESEIRSKFPDRYGRVDLAGGLGAYPLTLNHAENYIATRAVLIADAAHGIHPIAGQGLNLGFRDVGELASLVIAAHEQKKDIGAADLLETYQRRRRPDNMAMVAFTDGLVYLFSNDRASMKLIRRTGLKIVGRMPRAKRFFMKQAMADKE